MVPVSKSGKVAAAISAAIGVILLVRFTGLPHCLVCVFTWFAG